MQNRRNKYKLIQGLVRLIEALLEESSDYEDGTLADIGALKRAVEDCWRTAHNKYAQRGNR